MKEQKSKWVLRTFGLLVVASFVALITLKLCGILTCSWWWIFSPIWGAAALAVGFTGLIAIFFLIITSTTNKYNEER